MRAVAMAMLPKLDAERRLRTKGTQGLDAQGAYELVMQATGDERAARAAMLAKFEEHYDSQEAPNS